MQAHPGTLDCAAIGTLLAAWWHQREDGAEGVEAQRWALTVDGLVQPALQAESFPVHLRGPAVVNDFGELTLVGVMQ
jgi:hypothetical protein